jgi:PTH1 family peptidyl-tRNA hydrolase
MLESEQWARIRVGIGNDFSRGGQVDFVLGELSEEDRAIVPELADKIIHGMKDFATLGVQRAMNTVNAKPKPKDPEPVSEDPHPGL